MPDCGLCLFSFATVLTRSIELLRMVANIIAWNIWQMDGMKYVVPNSCHDATVAMVE